MIYSINISHKKRNINSYKILIGINLIGAIQDIIKQQIGNKYFIITDSNLNKLFGEVCLKYLLIKNINAYILEIPAGEKFKTRATKEQLENQLILLGANRSSVIISLGGGVVGDLAGFTAATLHRGVPYFQIPTTLIAQVDSSIGGKVGVNLPLGKNLIGTFYHPKKVYIDVSTLKTLPEREFLNGIAEVIKYGVILDKKLFEYIEKNRNDIMNRKKNAMIKIIKRCCELKRNIIQKDEREFNLRRILNFGHTIGHAIELLSNYKIQHGKAIAIGMVVEGKISNSLGLISSESITRLENLLKSYSLPTTIPSDINLKNLFLSTEQDKKVRDGIVYYTLIERIGKARVGVPLTTSEALELFLK